MTGTKNVQISEENGIVPPCSSVVKTMMLAAMFVRTYKMIGSLMT